MTIIGEPGTKIAVTSNQRTQFTDSCHPDEGGSKVPPKRRLLQEPHSVTFEKTPFFIVTAVKTSNRT
jgi:hypothetical protein